jgi:hypothetical protein
VTRHRRDRVSRVGQILQHHPATSDIEVRSDVDGTYVTDDHGEVGPHLANTLLCKGHCRRVDIYANDLTAVTN